MGERREAAALDAREMLAQRIDLADAGARAQQRAGDGLLFGEREALYGRDPVGRGAARHQHEDESSAVAAAASASTREVAASPASSGIGCPASITGMTRVGRP